VIIYWFPSLLSGYKIPVIENLGATLVGFKIFNDFYAVVTYFQYLQDQFDTIDFSDNDIRKLDGFPLLKRIKSLLLNNNRIMYNW